MPIQMNLLRRGPGWGRGGVVCTQDALDVRPARVACRSLLLSCSSLGGLWTTLCMAEAVCARELHWDQMIEGGLFVS